jgi:hypothetical protein
MLVIFAVASTLTRTEITAGFTFSTMSAKPVDRCMVSACAVAITLGTLGVLKPDVPAATTAIARPAADARSASRREAKALRPGLAGII